ncbi:hypothetical protein IY40_06030 [Serratia marcescens]|nr:hypothetical protein IY40_06030 [Serratia marcescens]
MHLFYYGKIHERILSNIHNTLKYNKKNKVMFWVDDMARASLQTLPLNYENVEMHHADTLKSKREGLNSHTQEKLEELYDRVANADVKEKGKCLSDLSRLLALYHYGGLYLDVDVVVNNELSENNVFSESNFKTHISIENAIVNVDFYDAIGIKDAFDDDLRDVLAELAEDYDKGYVTQPGVPGELVRIKPLIKRKLKDLLSDEHIDDALSEAELSKDILAVIADKLQSLDIGGGGEKGAEWI